MGKLQNYVNVEETERAKDNNYIETQYIGTSKNLLNADGKGKKGSAYYNVSDDRYYFRPHGEKEWYRVKPTNLKDMFEY